MNPPINPKEFLRNIRDNRSRIKALTERRDDFYNLTASAGLSGDVVKAGSPDSRVERSVIDLIQYDQQVSESIRQYMEELADAEQLISSIPDRRYQDVLRYRYLNSWTWEKIAEVMGYERTQIWRMHGRALIIFGYRMQHRAT